MADDQRYRVDLQRLPVWAQYAIALAIVAGIVAVALTVSVRKDAPGWLTEIAPPILGALAIVYVAARVLRRRR